MSYNHAIRISMSYDECKEVIFKWLERCNKAIAYEHEADDEVSRTHVHIALYGCEVRAEALKRMWPDAPRKGNEFWSFKDADESSRFITYMSKGKLTYKVIKNFSNQEVDRFRQEWVEPVKADKPGDSTEKIINTVMNNIKSKFVYHELTDEERYERVECSAETLLKLVRRETFHQLWKTHRKFPHGSHYKIVAGTAYMRLCEHYDCFDEGFEIISQLWL